MMLSLLYHRVGCSKYANPLSTLEQHFDWISKHANVVLPGERISLFSRDICLTFDDATFDFYYYVFPLLQRLKIRALLAIPAGLIQDKTDLDPHVRLSVPYSEAMKGDTYRTHVPFCTWAELSEMAKSGYVEIASHSFSHRNLLLQGLDLDLEIHGSKRLLEEKLHVPIRTFVYPLGKFNSEVHRQVRQHYEFAMRIGSSWNYSWQNCSQITYRVICDQLPLVEELFKFQRKLSYTWFYLINSLRRR